MTAFKSVRSRTFKLAAIPLLLAGLAACASPGFKADVSRFQSKLPAPQGETFAVVADDADEIMKKIKKAKTDPEPLPSEAKGLEERAEASNLVGIYGALAGKSTDGVLAEFGGQGFGVFKPALGELLVETLRPISARFVELKDDREALDAILARGAARARALGAPTLDATYKALGLVRG